MFGVRVIICFAGVGSIIGDQRVIWYSLRFDNEVYEVNEISLNTQDAVGEWQFMQLTAGKYKYSEIRKYFSV